MKKIFIAAICLSAFAGQMMAQEDVAMQYVATDRSPVTSAMGASGAAFAGDVAYASFNNPAVMPFASNRGGVGVSYYNWAPGGAKSTNLNLGFSQMFGKKFGLTLGGAYQAGEKYDVMDASGKSKGSFTPKDLLFNVGAALKITDGLSAGVNLHYASQSLSDDNSCSAFGADVLALYHWSKLNVTAGVKSVGSKVKSDAGEKYSLPASAVVAGSYDFEFGKSSVVANLDLNYYFCGSFAAAVGAEYSFNKLVSVRAGYHYGAEDGVVPSFLSLGAGVAVKGISLNLSYWTASDYLGNTLSIGLGYAW